MQIAIRTGDSKLLRLHHCTTCATAAPARLEPSPQPRNSPVKLAVPYAWLSRHCNQRFLQNHQTRQWYWRFGCFDFYMDKSVTESEAELVICHKETSYNIIKDTWVDEGYPTKDKIFIRTKVDEKIYKIYSWNCENKETVKDNIGINVLNPLAKEEPDQSKDLMQQDEDATRKLADNVYNEIVVPEDKILLQKLDIKRSRTSGFEGDEIKQNHAKVASEPEFHSQSEKSKNEIEDAVLSSPASESNIDIHDTSSFLQENGSITHRFDHSASGTSGKEESSQVSDCNCGQTQNADVKSDDYGVTNQVHQRLCELSFSSIGYSGPLPFSGSISLRSDRSIDSTWSFAFPM
ncbi:hypothetical protein GmHk_08G023437 [Glycine max]|nr:hypothetical protein GmHk_08G023437 [Glycine max]